MECAMPEEDKNMALSFWHVVLKCISDEDLEQSRPYQHQMKNQDVSWKLALENQETTRAGSASSFFKMPSQRLLNLAKPKKDFSKEPITYSCNHGSESWKRDRTCGESCRRSPNLAEPKKLSGLHQSKKSLNYSKWFMNRIAQNCGPSERAPSFRSKSVNSYYHANKEVSKSAKNAIASPRVAELALAKGVPCSYKPVRDPRWSVSIKTKLAVASPRTKELSQPLLRWSSCIEVSPPWALIPPAREDF